MPLAFTQEDFLVTIRFCVTNLEGEIQDSKCFFHNCIVSYTLTRSKR